MFNVLAWNIQFFTKKRIDDDSGDDSVTRAANSERTLANLLYITSTVEQSGADIFVVIEPRSSQGYVEQLATGGGADGLLYLLAQLREWMPARKWCLVPPLRLNPRDNVGKINTYTECIGVFWSDANLNFTGPNVWPGGKNKATGPPIPQGSGATAAYPAPWNRAVPTKTFLFAGQCRFYKGQKELMFPEEYNRRPFYTTFSERNAPNRTLKLFTMHTSPNTAGTALANLFGLNELAPGNGEVSLIIGDLNVNLNATNKSAYEVVRFHSRYSGFTLLASEPSTKRYYPTRVKAAVDATAASYLGPEALDYSFVSWGTNGKDGAASWAVVDRVAADPKPPFSSEISPLLAKYLEMTDGDERNRLFRLRWSYGHVAQPRRKKEAPDGPADGTSDHIPIWVKV